MANTSSRTLRLLSLLQARRYWPGAELAAQLQTEGAESFVSAWNDLIEHVKAQTARMG